MGADQKIKGAKEHLSLFLSIPTKIITERCRFIWEEMVNLFYPFYHRSTLLAGCWPDRTNCLTGIRFVSVEKTSKTHWQSSLASYLSPHSALSFSYHYHTIWSCSNSTKSTLKSWVSFSLWKKSLLCQRPAFLALCSATLSSKAGSKLNLIIARVNITNPIPKVAPVTPVCSHQGMGLAGQGLALPFLNGYLSWRG